MTSVLPQDDDALPLNDPITFDPFTPPEGITPDEESDIYGWLDSLHSIFKPVLQQELLEAKGITNRDRQRVMGPQAAMIAMGFTPAEDFGEHIAAFDAVVFSHFLDDVFDVLKNHEDFREDIEELFTNVDFKKNEQSRREFGEQIPSLHLSYNDSEVEELYHGIIEILNGRRINVEGVDITFTREMFEEVEDMMPESKKDERMSIYQRAVLKIIVAGLAQTEYQYLKNNAPLEAIVLIDEDSEESITSQFPDLPLRLDTWKNRYVNLMNFTKIITDPDGKSRVEAYRHADFFKIYFGHSVPLEILFAIESSAGNMFNVFSEHLLDPFLQERIDSILGTLVYFSNRKEETSNPEQKILLLQREDVNFNSLSQFLKINFNYIQMYLEKNYGPQNPTKFNDPITGKLLQIYFSHMLFKSGIKEYSYDNLPEEINQIGLKWIRDDSGYQETETIKSIMDGFAGIIRKYVNNELLRAVAVNLSSIFSFRENREG